MKFSFDEFHIWYQFALSLICAGKVRYNLIYFGRPSPSPDYLQFSRARLVLKECLNLQPTNPVILLLASKLCFENLHLVGLLFCCNCILLYLIDYFSFLRVLNMHSTWLKITRTVLCLLEGTLLLALVTVYKLMNAACKASGKHVSAKLSMLSSGSDVG
jgi:hypothetical protein